MLTFNETKLFTTFIGDYMSDEEYLVLWRCAQVALERDRPRQTRGDVAETIPAGVLKKIKEEIDG